MAEIILKNKLKLAGIDSVKVSSAGLSATDGTKISKNSALALKSIGLKSYSFKSKLLTKELVDKSDLIICMTLSHKRMLGGIGKAIAMSEITMQGDISDPYGGDLNVYKNTMFQIDDACNIILEKIIESKKEN